METSTTRFQILGLEGQVLSLEAYKSSKMSCPRLKDRKGFDTVFHKILCHYGIRKSAHKLLESYLASRRQFVTIQNYNSFLKSTNIGVLQCSILELPLFLLYINDMWNATSCNPRLFAYGTCLVVRNSKCLNMNVTGKCRNSLNGVAPISSRLTLWNRKQ